MSSTKNFKINIDQEKFEGLIRSFNDDIASGNLEYVKKEIIKKIGDCLSIEIE